MYIRSFGGTLDREMYERRNENLNPRTADAPLSGVLIGWPNGLLLQRLETSETFGCLASSAMGACDPGGLGY